MRKSETREAELPKVEEGDEYAESQKPLTITLDPPEPSQTFMRCLDTSKVLAGSSLGLVAAPFIYNASTTAWGIALAASVIGSFVMWLLYKKGTASPAYRSRS
jgi:hypothetical protein